MRFYPFVFTGNDPRKGWRIPLNEIKYNEQRDEETCYGYCDDYQPHAVKRMFDYNDGMLYDMRWDEAGNLGQVSMGRLDEMFEAGRFLFWTEDCCGPRPCGANRMHAAVDDRYYSYYAYDHSGGSCASREQSQACLSYAEMEQRRRSQRRLKLTGKNELMDVNADFMATYTILNEPTLYPSAYMVLTNKGYTKHYYAGTERVAARLGGGGLNAQYHVIGNDVELQTKADILFKQSIEQMNSRVLNENNLDCIMSNEFAKEEFGHPIEGIPYQMKADVEFDYGRFNEMVNSMLTDYHNGEEEEVYFYHSDHLGSASWITDNGGLAVQHLQYLPYGERYVDQRISGYSERFTFTGKERDEETGYGYFGARYMDHELMTMWLSVDPMADKYPSISPYAYCAWNPVKLVDPDGREIDISALEKKNKKGEYVHKQLRDAFIAFANTETGKRELAKYAKKGQHFYGIYFSENGEYHNEGINIKFSDYSQLGNSGVTIPKKKGENLSIEIKTSNFTDISACLENIGHEFFIHANQAIKDYRDNGFLDHSFLPKKLINEVKNSNNSQNYAYTKAEHKYFAYHDVTSRKDLVKMMQESKMYKNKTEIINLINGGLGNNIKMNTNGL